ncbi:Uncharacterised protein [Providencia stuartii]|nr:Uncharacterised protein [Providencia stuartii]
MKKVNGVEDRLRHKAVQYIRLNELFLDVENPRFGEDASSGSTQVDVLNNIVKNYGVNDVISSLAVNGYFSAEPIGCQKKWEKTTI